MFISIFFPLFLHKKLWVKWDGYTRQLFPLAICEQESRVYFGSGQVYVKELFCFAAATISFATGCHFCANETLSNGKSSSVVLDVQEQAAVIPVSFRAQDSYVFTKWIRVLILIFHEKLNVGFFFSAFDSAPSKHFIFVFPRFFDWRQFVLAADRNANIIFSTNVLSYAYSYHCYVVWKNWLSWRENYAGQTRRDIQYKHQFWFRRNNASKYEISIWCPPLNWRYFVLSTAEVFYLTFEPH